MECDGSTWCVDMFIDVVLGHYEKPLVAGKWRPKYQSRDILAGGTCVAQWDQRDPKGAGTKYQSGQCWRLCLRPYRILRKKTRGF